MADSIMSVQREDLSFAVSAIGEIHALQRRAESVDLRAAESDKSETAHEALFRTIIGLADDTHAAIARIAAHDEEDDVSDIATLAAIPLQERRGLLAHVQPCDHWSFLESCERAVRGVLKSACAVEAALARQGGLPAQPAGEGDLDIALRIRRRYAALRRAITRSSPDADVATRLSGARASIAVLLQSEEYGSMRMGDRRELRMLQFRIQSWLSSEHPSSASGDRLWEEVTAVANLLNAINRRCELMIHDAAALTALFEAVRAHADLPLMREQAAPLAGLDPDLDALLESEPAGAEEWARWERAITSLLNEKGVSPPCIVPVG